MLCSSSSPILSVSKHTHTEPFGESHLFRVESQRLFFVTFTLHFVCVCLFVFLALQILCLGEAACWRRPTWQGQHGALPPWLRPPLPPLRAHRRRPWAGVPLPACLRLPIRTHLEEPAVEQENPQHPPPPRHLRIRRRNRPPPTQRRGSWSAKNASQSVGGWVCMYTWWSTDPFSYIPRSQNVVGNLSSYREALSNRSTCLRGSGGAGGWAIRHGAQVPPGKHGPSAVSCALTPLNKHMGEGAVNGEFHPFSPCFSCAMFVCVCVKACRQL